MTSTIVVSKAPSERSDVVLELDTPTGQLNGVLLSAYVRVRGKTNIPIQPFPQDLDKACKFAIPQSLLQDDKVGVDVFILAQEPAGLEGTIHIVGRLKLGTDPVELSTDLVLSSGSIEGSAELDWEFIP